MPSTSPSQQPTSGPTSQPSKEVSFCCCFVSESSEESSLSLDYWRIPYHLITAVISNMHLLFSSLLTLHLIRLAAVSESIEVSINES